MRTGPRPSTGAVSERQPGTGGPAAAVRPAEYKGKVALFGELDRDAHKSMSQNGLEVFVLLHMRGARPDQDILTPFSTPYGRSGIATIGGVGSTESGTEAEP
jgi:hypothetical protein